MEYILLLPLMPKGKWAQAGAYSKFSSRSLRFDISIRKEKCRNYDTLLEEEIDTFSMCGSPTKRWSGCQCIEQLVSEYRDRVPQRDLSDFDRLVKIWREYHLNDKTAGTRKQEEALREWKQNHTYDYREACNYLDDLGLLVDREYKYGSGWLAKPICEDDMTFLRRICHEWSKER